MKTNVCGGIGRLYFMLYEQEAQTKGPLRDREREGERETERESERERERAR